jgi:hypothetical protein
VRQVFVDPACRWRNNVLKLVGGNDLIFFASRSVRQFARSRRILRENCGIDAALSHPIRTQRPLKILFIIIIVIKSINSLMNSSAGVRTKKFSFASTKPSPLFGFYLLITFYYSVFVECPTPRNFDRFAESKYNTSILTRKGKSNAWIDRI